MKIKFIFFCVVLICSNLFAQSQIKTNLDIINSLVDESIGKIVSGQPFEDISYHLTYNSAPEYNYMTNRTKAALGKYVSVTENKDQALYNISYSIDEISTSYNNLQKSSLFGTYSVARDIKLKGSFILGVKGKSVKSETFELTSSDTVEMDTISELESMTLPFTRGKKPDEPFFASLLEPAIAIGAIAVTIVLFFTVRSN